MVLRTTYPEGWTKINWDDNMASAYLKDAEADSATKVQKGACDPSEWLDGFYDDDLWWALAWINAYDITKDVEYLRLAEGIFMAVTKSWPSKCGNGGIYWSYVFTISRTILVANSTNLGGKKITSTPSQTSSSSLQPHLWPTVRKIRISISTGPSEKLSGSRRPE